MRIQIIGSGWLAQPLAHQLQAAKHQVSLTSTQSTKISQLNADGLACIQYTLGQACMPDSILEADVLVIAITSKDVEAYRQFMSQLNPDSDQHLIFISSTSVYANDGQVHDESSQQLNPNSPIHLIEQVMMSHPRWTVLRMAGLVGPGRHPGRFFQTGRTLKNPHAPVNLVHLDDCIGVIEAVIDQQAWGQVFNVCADTHPNKMDFYTAMAEQLGSGPPQFETTSTGSHKTIANQKIKQRLDYQLIHPDVMSMPFV